MTQKKIKPQEIYLKMPNHILNCEELGKSEMILLSHIYSFGRKGCWQSNEKLGMMFFRKARTISLWVSNLKKGGFILWLHPKGYYRTLWAKSHPEVKIAQSLLYRGREISKAAIINGQIESVSLCNKSPSKYAKSCEVSTQKDVIPLSKKLLHTNNTISKDIMEGIKTIPSPLPAGGQAPVLLEDRRNEKIVKIEEAKKHFGSSVSPQRLTQEEFDNRLREQKKMLLATKVIEQS